MKSTFHSIAKQNHQKDRITLTRHDRNQIKNQNFKRKTAQLKNSISGRVLVAKAT